MTRGATTFAAKAESHGETPNSSLDLAEQVHKRNLPAGEPLLRIASIG